MRAVMRVGVVWFGGVRRVDCIACGADGVLDDVVDINSQFFHRCPSVKRNLIQEAALGGSKLRDTGRHREEAKEEDPEGREDELGLHERDGGQSMKEGYHKQPGQDEGWHLVVSDMHYEPISQDV